VPACPNHQKIKRRAVMDPHKMTQLANAEQKEMSMKSEGLHSSTTSTLAELLASFCEGKKEKKLVAS